MVEHLLAEIRDRATDPPRFRFLVRLAGALVSYEATRDLPSRPERIETPLESCEVRRLALPITIVPILRAGLGMADGAMDILPEAQVGHLGMRRDEDRLEPVSYFEKMPANLERGPVLVVDPMLATGGSAAAAFTALKRHGCGDIRLVCLVAAPEGAARLHEAHPDVRMFAGALDRELNARGFILPGLGDAGDRMFGTL